MKIIKTSVERREIGEAELQKLLWLPSQYRLIEAKVITRVAERRALLVFEQYEMSKEVSMSTLTERG